MTSPSSVSSLTPKFDDFLFARIEENGETPLSVLSVLARLGIDPWEEAASLAQLPPILMAFILMIQVVAINRQPPTRDQEAHAPVTGKVLP